MGLACAIFIILFMRDEISYDKWIPGSENLYRVELDDLMPGQAPMDQTAVVLSGAAGDAGADSGSDAHDPSHPDSAMTVTDRRPAVLRKVSTSVDPDFFQVIKLPLVEGDPATCSRPARIRRPVTDQARKYFGDAEPLGKTIMHEREPAAMTRARTAGSIRMH